MSKVIISAIATLAAVILTAGTVTLTGGAHPDGARSTVKHDGYYITELRKSDRLATKQ